MTKSIEIVLPKKFILALDSFIKTPTSSTYSRLTSTRKVPRLQSVWKVAQGPNKKEKWETILRGYTNNKRLPVLMCQLNAVPWVGSCFGCPLSAGVWCLVYSLWHQKNLSRRVLAAIELQAALKVTKYVTVGEDFVQRCTGEKKARMLKRQLRDIEN